MEKPTEYTLTWEVTDEMTAKRIGSAGSKILSTPNMVALMEAAALELAKAYLDEGMTTVGAEIHCRHLAPTPVGMKVSATARLRSIERRKMWFDIEVNDEKVKCGEGSHLRIMVAPKGSRRRRSRRRTDPRSVGSTIKNGRREPSVFDGWEAAAGQTVPRGKFRSS